MSPIELLLEKKNEIETICRQYEVRRLRLFGSALTNEWDSATSDFDFLVEYKPESQSLPAFDQLVGLQLSLEDLLGRNVDVVNWDTARNRFFRESAEAEARELYAA